MQAKSNKIKPSEGMAMVVGGAIIIPTLVTSMFVFCTVCAVATTLDV